jgi:hypothetical protein
MVGLAKSTARQFREAGDVSREGPLQAMTVDDQQADFGCHPRWFRRLIQINAAQGLAAQYASR